MPKYNNCSSSSSKMSNNCIRDYILKENMSHTVILWSKSYSSDCRSVKKMLRSALAPTGTALAVREMDVEKQGFWMEKELQVLTGERSVSPIVFVNGVCIGGYDDVKRAIRNKSFFLMLVPLDGTDRTGCDTENYDDTDNDEEASFSLPTQGEQSIAESPSFSSIRTTGCRGRQLLQDIASCRRKFRATNPVMVVSTTTTTTINGCSMLATVEAETEATVAVYSKGRSFLGATSSHEKSNPVVFPGTRRMVPGRSRSWTSKSS